MELHYFSASTHIGSMSTLQDNSLASGELSKSNDSLTDNNNKVMRWKPFDNFFVITNVN